MIAYSSALKMLALFRSQTILTASGNNSYSHSITALSAISVHSMETIIFRPQLVKPVFEYLWHKMKR